MDTSISSKDFRVADLMRSEWDEEKELAVNARRVIETLVDRLKPILKYVAILREFGDITEAMCQNYRFTPNFQVHPKRVLHLLEGTEEATLYLHLFLSEEGKFFIATKCSRHRAPEHYHVFEAKGRGLLTWEAFSFQQLLTSLQEALQKATEKRETHLESIRERRKILDEMLEVLKRGER